MQAGLCIAASVDYQGPWILSSQTRKQTKQEEVSWARRQAASKVAGRPQAAIQASKKSGCHLQSVVTLSKMFKKLQADKEDAEVH